MGMVDDLSDPSKRIVGSKQVIKHAGSRKIRKVFIAKDADEPLIKKLKETCERNGIEYDMSHTMQQIGYASGIEVGSACAALKKTKDIPFSLRVARGVTIKETLGKEDIKKNADN